MEIIGPGSRHGGMHSLGYLANKNDIVTNWRLKVNKDTKSTKLYLLAMTNTTKGYHVEFLSQRIRLIIISLKTRDEWNRFSIWQGLLHNKFSSEVLNHQYIIYAERLRSLISKMGASFSLQTQYQAIL